MHQGRAAFQCGRRTARHLGGVDQFGIERVARKQRKAASQTHGITTDRRARCHIDSSRERRFLKRVGRLPGSKGLLAQPGKLPVAGARVRMPGVTFEVIFHN